MREAIGGALTIQIILVFLILVNGYLIMTVNYTKAFRIKNNIISIIEQNEGITEQAGKDISAIMRDAGYSVATGYLNSCSSIGYKAVYPSQLSALGTSATSGGFCYKRINVDPTGSGKMIGREYSIMTFVDVNVPGLNRLLELIPEVFSVKGETKTIYSNKVDKF